jgi:hypothetical protein
MGRSGREQGKGQFVVKRPRALPWSGQGDPAAWDWRHGWWPVDLFLPWTATKPGIACARYLSQRLIDRGGRSVNTDGISPQPYPQQTPTTLILKLNPILISLSPPVSVKTLPIVTLLEFVHRFRPMRHISLPAAAPPAAVDPVAGRGLRPAGRSVDRPILFIVRKQENRLVN